MDLVRYKDIKNCIQSTIKLSEDSNVYRLTNGDYFKKFSNRYLYQLFHDYNINLKGKILSSHTLKDIPEIVTPKSIISTNKIFKGYISPQINGISLKEIVNSSSLNLYESAKLYLKIENIVKRCKNHSIYFPDLCTFDNIIVNDENVFFIDYDGLQIEEYEALAFSTLLGEPEKYFNQKYIHNSLGYNLWTENLDKKSLFLLYLALTFHINPMILEKMINKIDILDCFYELGLDNVEILEKILKYYDKKYENEYFSDSASKIAELYNLKIVPYHNDFYKILVKK